MELNWSENPFLSVKFGTEMDLDKYPFLITDAHEFLRGIIKSTLLSGYATFLIVGEKGTGKTTTLNWLKRYAESQASEMHDKTVKTLMINRITINPEYIYTHLGFNSLEEMKSAIRYNNNLIVIIFSDLPDDTSQEAYRKFLDMIENLIKDAPRIAHIIAVNNEVKKMIDQNVSMLFGKFGVVPLEKFNDAQAQKLIDGRLQAAGITAKIFDDDSYHIINNFARGIPRNILLAANSLITKSDNPSITSKIASDLLKTSYATDILSDRIQSQYLRERLTYIYDIIRNRFNGYVENKKALEEEIGRYSHMTFLKYLKIMENMGVIEVTQTYDRKGDSIIRSVIRLVDAE